MFSYHGYNQHFNYCYDYYYNHLNHHHSSRLGIISFQYIFCYLRGILAYILPHPLRARLEVIKRLRFIDRTAQMEHKAPGR